jgi:hypothetical protein
MPSMTAKYRGLHGIDLDQFPSEIKLRHGIEKAEREWWEWANGKRGQNRKAITIQRPNQKLSWVIFFDQADRTRTLELPVPEQEKARGVIAITFGTFDLNQAIKALADIGINAKLEKQC